MTQKPKLDEAIRKKNNWIVRGDVHWEQKKTPIADATVMLLAHSAEKEVQLGSGKTDKGGKFVIQFSDVEEAARFRQGFAGFFIVKDSVGRILFSTHDTPMRPEGWTWEVSLEVAGMPIDPSRTSPLRRQIKMGPISMDAEQVAKATPEDALNIARLIRKQKIPDAALKRLEALSLDAIPERLAKRTLSITPLLRALDVLIKHKKWPREVALEIERILKGGAAGFAAHTYSSTNFLVTYYDSGVDAVDPDTSAQDVNEPGSNPPVAIDTLPAGDPPTYVKRVVYWLEKALNYYISPPFSMLNPAAGGQIDVYIEDTSFGGATPSAFYIDNDLPADIICAVAVHELFHMVQYEYAGTGTWEYSVTEGGAVVAEDAVADLMNRYLDECTTNFNGVGVMSNPNLSLASAGYKACLFWRYIAEQQSPDFTEPFVGVETYRTIIEHCAAGTWSTADIKNAIRDLPYYQDFYEFGYNDPAKTERTSSETILGNYALACYLKDLGTNVPDRRFEFMEDEEEIRIDDILQPVLGAATEPSQTYLASVTLAGTGTVTPAASVTFNGSVNTFASRYYEVTVDSAVTNLSVQFTGAAGLTSSIFQIALIDEDGHVRDIHRSDANSYTKRLTNLQDGKRLTKVVLVVTGANSSGSFTLSVSSAAAAPDVMVTRWHSVVKTEYEIDSRNWAWTWVSPDVWVDNDNDGVADGEVWFNYDNKLHIRLHNKGNADATGIQVGLSYTDASGGLGSWLPVQNKALVTQVLTGLSLPAGTSQDWTVDWSPVASGSSSHYCVRAVVTVPGDPNTDNKMVFSNFGNVKIKPWGFIDLEFLRRHFRLNPVKVSLRIVPRFPPEFRISRYDLLQHPEILLQPGEAVLDQIRIEHTPLGSQFTLQTTKKTGLERVVPVTRRVTRPNLAVSYPVDPRTLPPGVAGKPMITVVHEVEGRPIGGITFLITLDKTK